MSQTDVQTQSLRRLLAPTKQSLWSGYVQVGPAQSSWNEYCNVSGVPQIVRALLLNDKGDLLTGTSVQERVLDPNAILRMDAQSLLAGSGLEAFNGQMAMVIEPAGSDPGAPIPPAVTSHWRSTRSYCEVGTQAMSKLNTPSSVGKTSFFMFCPSVIVSPKRETVCALFNPSTYPDYRDTVELTPILRNPAGGSLRGAPFLLPPFGLFKLDVAKYFGAAAKDLLQPDGHGTLSIAHIGHILPSFFFHVDPVTGHILSGQHTQPPANVMTPAGIWWGRLRRFAL